MMRNISLSLAMLLLASSISLFSACSGQSTEGAQQESASAKEGGSPAAANAPSALVKKIGVAELVELMASDPKLQLLDVRTPGEVAGGTIKGAKAINVHDADFASRAAVELDKTRPVAVYCAAGSRSSAAIPMLKGQGFSTLYNLSGGIQAWTGQGLELTK